MLKPFVKWAGGKGQLLNNIRKMYPTELGKSINKYCEPFVGGGAVLFDILSNYNLEAIYINDINVELINTYKVIRDDVESLILKLSLMQDEFIRLDTENRKLCYYSYREKYNVEKLNDNKNNNLEKAALFIFLNKTCFNGLYRVNSKSLYNVPMGAYKSPRICDESNLRNISIALQKTKLNAGDYKECLPFVDKRTFVYLDPPYRPITQTSNFTSYTENQFDDIAQKELADFVGKLNKIGASVVQSNSDPKNTDSQDEFFDNLYSDYNIKRISAKRMINCNGASRGNVNEILICNF